MPQEKCGPPEKSQIRFGRKRQGKIRLLQASGNQVECILRRIPPKTDVGGIDALRAGGLLELLLTIQAGEEQLQAGGAGVQPGIRPGKLAIEELELLQAARAPAVVAIIDPLGRPDELPVQAAVAEVLVPEWIDRFVSLCEGLGECLSPVLQEREKQTRMDRIVACHDIDDLPGRALAAKRVVREAGEEAGPLEDFLLRRKSDRRWAIDDLAVGQDMECRAGKRQIVGWHAQGVTGRQGRHLRQVRIRLGNLFQSGVKVRRQGRKGVA